MFNRLNVFPIHLPSLRERRSDIPLLIRNFVGKYAGRMRKHIDVIPDETMRVLCNWNWPGNVRELENVIERMMILTGSNVLAPAPAELETPQEVEGEVSKTWNGSTSFASCGRRMEYSPELRVPRIVWG